MTHYYTLMSCNGLEWIQPPSSESRLPGCYAYYDPPARIVDELNRLVDRNKRLEDIINRAHSAFFSDSSHRKVSIAMHRILNEEVRKESP